MTRIVIMKVKEKDLGKHFVYRYVPLRMDVGQVAAPLSLRGLV